MRLVYMCRTCMRSDICERIYACAWCACGVYMRRIRETGSRGTDGWGPRCTISGRGDVKVNIVKFTGATNGSTITSWGQ